MPANPFPHQYVSMQTVVAINVWTDVVLPENDSGCRDNVLEDEHRIEVVDFSVLYLDRIIQYATEIDIPHCLVFDICTEKKCAQNDIIYLVTYQKVE